MQISTTGPRGEAEVLNEANCLRSRPRPELWGWGRRWGQIQEAEAKSKEGEQNSVLIEYLT